MFFKERKTKKQLLQEIEQLKAENRRYNDWLRNSERDLNSIRCKIKKINAVCISHDYELNQETVKECLCNRLAKEIAPYVSIETYKMVGEPWNGEYKHFATVYIVEKWNQSLT